MTSLLINGTDLTLEDLRQVVYHRRTVGITEAARDKVTAAREVVDKLVQ